MKSKNLWLGLIVVVLVVSTLACQVAYNVDSNPITISSRTVRGSGTLVTEERSVSSFNSLELSSVGRLVIELGDQESLRVEAEENLLEYIETEVRGRTLQIGSRRGVSLIPTESINFYLTVVSLDSIMISGLGDVLAPDLQAETFSIDISGGGNLNLDSLDADRLRVGISGLGSLDIDGGQVRDQDIEISGAGDYNAGQLESRTAEVDISGLGSATLRVSDHLEANISGSGSVSYYGNPRVDENISGIGRVEQIDQ
ncbi:MAG: DUF2807 domain-containing protein [Anaerolineales bacterium]|nr:MAG: DUF2807 domain-containing protein [Anaerolineales bacterium]